ncbi:uncharacterized protein LOC111310566 [Durio zibethinus]|uniref:Uncharacterized protein LOC111310566 n=1 Tax=Durio zibethinus TaxID=66656 RepID=A0A6P6ALQ3_DURZI|nr:uncharacterized protein LOC111310566 [Durio zibethinus]
METTSTASTVRTEKLQPLQHQPLRPEQGVRKMRAMVGIDESDESFHALQWTLDNLLDRVTAAAPEASEDDGLLITLVHVQQPFYRYLIPAGPGGTAFYMPSSVEESIKNDQEQISKALLNRASHMCKDKMVKVETLILEGDPKEEICQATEQMHVDLLIVGNRNLGKIKRAFLGSVSDYYAHHANCPVLIVKPPKEANEAATNAPN